jgi:hypothetical protein
MRVRFPLGCGQADSDFRVFADGQSLTTTIFMGEVIIHPLPPLYRGIHCDVMPWAGFDVSFPVSRSVTLSITYPILPTEESVALASFGYLLETGAGWYGPIEKADFVLRLPYPAVPDNAIGWWNASQPFKDKYVGNEIRWHVDNLEPAKQNNLTFQVQWPEVWQPIFNAQATLSANPKDLDALLLLGQAYDAAAATFHGGTDSHFLNLSLKTYEQALQLDRYSAEAHGGAAWELLQLEMAGHVVCPQRLKDPRALYHLSLALALDPETESAGMPLMLWRTCWNYIKLPTADPRLLPTPSATPTPTSTFTPMPTPSTTPTPTLTFTPSPEPSRTSTFEPTATAVVTRTQRPAPQQTALGTPKPTSTAILTPSVGPNGPLPIIVGLIGILVLGGLVGVFLHRRKQ